MNVYGDKDVSIDREEDKEGWRTRVEVNEGTQDGNDDESGDGAGRMEERGICARKPRRVLDVMCKTVETWRAQGENNYTKKCWFRGCQPR